ncbi:MAG: archaeosortase/exosortase family protein [Bacteroidales bacterium]|nr:archaeosortase/exosortase family protein [Bacteroidales bacterium]
MGKPLKKKGLKKKEPRPSPFAGIRSNWRQKLPVLIFVLGFAVLMILFYVYWLSDYSQNIVQPKVVQVNAGLSNFILNIFGMGTTTVNGTISSARFSVNIARGCDAMEAMALFASALLTFPARWNYKLIGFFSGIALLFSLNILRVVSLFLTGIYFPKAFEIMHVEVWQVLFIIFAIGLFIFWIRWTRKGVTDVAK